MRDCNVPDCAVCGYLEAGESPATPREQVLEEARAAITQDRNVDYGPPEDNFRDTAELLTTYLGDQLSSPLTSTQVAAIMILLKVARLRTSPGKKDHWVDIAGYAACGWQCAANSEE